jgi:hypothetical protein
MTTIHYRNRHSAKALSSAALGKEGSAHSASAKPSLPSNFSRALGREVCRVPDSIRQRKVAVTAPGDRDGVFAEYPGYTRQRSYLCRVSDRQHSAKNPSLPSATWDTRQRTRQRGSPCQVLCRVLGTALGKACFFAECQRHHTRQRTYTGAQVLVLCRVL